MSDMRDAFDLIERLRRKVGSMQERINQLETEAETYEQAIRAWVEAEKRWEWERAQLERGKVLRR